MIIEEEVYLAYEAEDFLNHHGVKGQKWGIRNKAVTVGKTIGRGTKKTTQYVKDRPAGTEAVIGFGLIAAMAVLRHRRNVKLRSIINYYDDGEVRDVLGNLLPHVSRISI